MKISSDTREAIEVAECLTKRNKAKRILTGYEIRQQMLLIWLLTRAPEWEVAMAACQVRDWMLIPGNQLEEAHQELFNLAREK